MLIDDFWVGKAAVYMIEKASHLLLQSHSMRASMPSHLDFHTFERWQKAKSGMVGVNGTYWFCDPDVSGTILILAL